MCHDVTSIDAEEQDIVMAVQTYRGPDTEGLDIFGLKAAIIRGERDDTRVLPVVQSSRVSSDPTKPFLRKGKRRKAMHGGLWWFCLSLGLSLVFVAVVWFATMGVYSWLRAHGG
jgi:hypothetical protein